MDTQYFQQVVLETAERTGAFCELFLEQKAQTTASARGQDLKVSTTGLGLRLLSGGLSVYASTSDASRAGVEKLSQEAIRLARASGLPREKVLLKEGQPEYYPAEIEPASAEQLSALAQAAGKAGRALGERLKNPDASVNRIRQKVTIINSEGIFRGEERGTTSIRLRYQMETSRGRQSDWMDHHTVGGSLPDPAKVEAYFAGQLMEAVPFLEADPMPAGEYPVVMAAGDAGTLWHECCGHQLEACAILDGSSDFCGRLGQRVASEKVTLIDDGTIPSLYGSSVLDDEGHYRQKNTLIEAGILKNYLCDKYNGERLGLSSNGCGRREDYTFVPTSRMSNTYLAAGTDDEEEIIGSVPYGLYVQQLGGGSGGSVFSLLCTQSFLIENGKLTRPVGRAMLTGRGSEIMQRIDRVGTGLVTDMGSLCGAGSGLIPVTSFQPMVRICSMRIGGGL